MKRTRRFLCMLVAVLLLAAWFPVSVSALETGFWGTVGEAAYFPFFTSDNDIIWDAYIYQGSVPGMALYYSDTDGVALTGTPTQAGVFTIRVRVEAQPSGDLDYTIHVTIDEPPAPTEATTAPTSPPAPAPTQPPETEPPIIDPPVTSGTPIVTKHPTDETVVEGDSAIFIALADNARQYCWEIGIADASMDCADLPSYLGDGVTVSGCYSNTLVISNVSKNLDGAYVWCRIVGAEESTYSGSAIITVIPAPLETTTPTEAPKPAEASSPTAATTAPTEDGVKANERNKSKSDTPAAETTATEAPDGSARVPGNNAGRNTGKKSGTENDSGFPIAAIIAIVAVVISGIAAVVILKLKRRR